MMRLFGRQKPTRFITQGKYESTSKKQAAFDHETLAVLRKYGVNDTSRLRLEYFFYTDSPDKAAALATVLRERGYSSESRQVEGDKRLHVATGWTTPLQMNEATVVNWSEEMCRIGFEHDCEFDGWGTQPDQKDAETGVPAEPT